MGFHFDVDKIMRHVTNKASDLMLQRAEQARVEMGAEGDEIEISPTFSASRAADDKLNVGNIRFPSEEIKARFLEIYRRKFR